MRMDEHGGFAIFITADEVKHFSTNTWIGEQEASFKKGEPK